MRVRKDLQQNFGIINTIRNINKLNPSHNINLTKIQYPEKNKTIILQKTSPNNNIPIKVKLVKSNQTHNMNQTQLNYSQYNKLQASPQKRMPLDQIYKDQTSKLITKNKLCNSSSKILDDDLNLNNNHKNINQTEINKLRHSLIYAKEKQTQIEKEGQGNQNFSKKDRKYISMSPKLTLRFKEENDKGKIEIRNKINRGFVIQKNPSLNENINKEDENNNKTTERAPRKHEHKIRNLLSKNFPYNKPKPTNKLGSSYSILKKKSGEENKNLINSINSNQLSGETAKLNNQYYNDDAMSVTSFNNLNNMNNNMMMNSPRTTASFMTDIDNNNNNYIRNTQQNRYYKISMSPNRNINMNKTSYNYYNNYNNNNQNITSNDETGFNEKLNNNINKNINDSYNDNIIYNNANNIKKNLEIKLEDLIMIEERLNDICISLNNNTNDLGASNECIEFFVFYFHSSLTYKFPLLFHENKRILIQSAINLKLFTIVMTYHLSMNIQMLSDVLLYLKNIYSLLKLNLYLFIKKIQIFYGEAFVLQNEMYFKTFNYLLSRNGYDNMNENEIVDLVQNNCYNIVQSLSEIINYYESVGNNYYLDFLELFNTISKLTEKEINNYFYNYLYASRGGGQPPLPRMEYHPLPARMRNNLRNNFYISNQTINNYNNININNLNNLNDINFNKNVNINNPMNNKILKNNNILYEYQKNKISPPFLKEPCAKKYTLVLDINNTLLNIQYGDKNNGQPNLRPGLFSFLGAIKPYYELVSFTSDTKENSDMILKEIEKNRKYFDYNLYKDHTTLYGNKFIKDINKLGRDIRKIIIIDDEPSNFILNPENGIQISPYLGDSTKDDTILFELKKLLILFHRTGGDDIRKAIKSYDKDIKEKISLNYSNKKY